MRQRARIAGQAGFTLAELLVASVLLSVVMATVYSVFWSVLVPWRAVEHSYDAYRESRNAMALIEREFANLVPDAAHLFTGDEAELTLFAVTEPMDVEKSEGRHLMRVRYQFKKSSNELEREEALVTTPLPKLPPGQDQEVDKTRVKVKQKREFVVASNVEDFTVRYVWLPAPEGRKPETPPTPIDPVYASRHKEKWGYPQGVEITLTLRDPEKKEGVQVFRQLIPLGVPNTLRSMKELTKLLGSGLSTS